MTRTIKKATMKRSHYDNHDQLRTHLADFRDAGNFVQSPARRLVSEGHARPALSRANSQCDNAVTAAALQVWRTRAKAVPPTSQVRIDAAMLRLLRASGAGSSRGSAD